MVEEQLHWIISKPMSEVRQYDSKTGTFDPPSKALLDTPLKRFRKGDQVEYYPGYLMPLRGSKLIDLIKATDRGMNRVINPNDAFDKTAKIYDRIGHFRYRNDRLSLVHKFEAGKLKFKDLVGDHMFYEGHARGPKGIWIIYTGS